jgi:glycosyltransferase family 4
MNYIYLINECSRASVYGIGTYIDQMTKCLSSISDVVLNVVEFYSVKEEYCIEEINGVFIHYVPCEKILSITSKKKYYRNAFYVFSKNIDICSNDKLIFHLNYNNEFYLIDLIRLKWKTSLIYFTIHYQEWCFKLKGDLDRLKNIIDGNDISDLNESVLTSFKCEKYIYDNVDKIICLSRYTDYVLKNIYNVDFNKIQLVYNGITYLETSSVNEPNAIKSKLGFDNEEKIILFVGRLDEAKGVDLLIDAFKIVLNEVPLSRLIVVGDGDFSKYYSKIVGYWNKITFTGRLDKNLLFEFYQIADVGVMPSFHEQCSYVAIEMMMMGVPLITSDSTGLKEMQANKEFMLKTYINNNEMYINPDEIAEKIILAIGQDKYRFYDKCEDHINQYSFNTMSQLVYKFYY